MRTQVEEAPADCGKDGRWKSSEDFEQKKSDLCQMLEVASEYSEQWNASGVSGGRKTNPKATDIVQTKVVTGT